MKFIQRAADFFFKVWKDPVWSKVISVGIITAIAVFWAKLTNHTWGEIYNFIVLVLAFRLPLYFFLSLAALYFIVRKCIQLFRNRKDPFWDQQMGNYTFKELYNILVSETLPIRTVGMDMSRRKTPDDNLLILFLFYYIPLSRGFGFYDNMDDDNYLYAVLAPRFVGYGLVDIYDEIDENLPDQKNKGFKISEMGHRFHAGLDKIRLKEKLKEIKAETKKKKKQSS